MTKNSKTRAGLVCSSFWPIEGGAERQLREVFGSPEVLDRCNTRVFAEPQNRAGAFGQLEICGGNTRPRTQHQAHAEFVFRTLTGLHTWRPKIVISSQVGLATGLAGQYAAMRGIPHVVRLASSGVLPTPGGGYDLDPLGRRTRKWVAMRRLLFRGACEFVAPAEHLLDEVVAQYPVLANRVHLIPNGVARRPDLPEGDGEPTADGIWYGRDDWFKNPDDFARLAQLTPDLSYLSVGRSKILNEPNIADLGWVTDPLAAIGRARVVVMTSRYEGSPNFAIQALSLGVPVVGYEIAGLRELAARHPYRVFLAEQGDVQGLAKMVRVVLGLERSQPVDTPAVEDVAGLWLDLIERLTHT